MYLFNSSDYSGHYPPGEVSLPVGSPLYVGFYVALLDISFAVVLEDCYATPTSNPNSMRHYFIQNKWVSLLSLSRWFVEYNGNGKKVIVVMCTGPADRLHPLPGVPLTVNRCQWLRMARPSGHISLPCCSCLRSITKTFSFIAASVCVTWSTPAVLR